MEDQFWYKEGIWWYEGINRLKSISVMPWCYIIPPLYFLKGLSKPTEKTIIKFDRPKVITEEFKIKKQINQLF